MSEITTSKVERLEEKVAIAHTIHRKRAVMKDLKKAKKKNKKVARQLRRKCGEKPQVPKTLENTREPDLTVLDDNDENAERLEEVNRDMDTDEFCSYFNCEYEPKVLLTYSTSMPSRKTRRFVKDLTHIIPNSMQFLRNGAAIKKNISKVVANGFSDMIIINEDQKKPNGMIVCHLPNGPTAYFRLSSVKTTKEMNKNLKEVTSHRPEVVLNNFSTRLGNGVARMLGALFHYSPEFKGRRAVTFHNQRDFIFFRHHRYQFDKKGNRAALMELGPRFTIRLQSLQKGTFDSKFGDYEWIIAGRRHEMETSRRRFFL